MMPRPAVRSINPALRKEIVITETRETGLHEGGRDHAEAQALPKLVGGSVQQPLQQAAGKGLETVLQRQHAEQEDSDAGGDFLELRADPKTPRQNEEDDGQENFLQHREPPA